MAKLFSIGYRIMFTILALNLIILVNSFTVPQNPNKSDTATAAKAGTDDDYKPDERVVGGQNARIEDYPYQISLQYHGKHICGGAILSARHILTATHCVTYSRVPQVDLTVVSGVQLLTYGGQTHRVETVVMHPNYQQSQDGALLNDISIVVLAQPMSFNMNQRPIAITSTNVPNGQIALATGWGLTDKRSKKVSTILQATWLRVFSYETCVKQGQVTVHKSSFCALNRKGVGLCSGDSGGPLVINRQVVGIASTTVPCALGYPDVFTNVYLFRQFIENVMNMY